METVRNVPYFIFVLLEVILIFNLLIVVHELGHFLAARWRGLVVEQFAVWFGKPIWKRTYNGVVYSLGSIPFGGFVKLPQMAPMDAIEGESATPREVMPAVSPLDKIIVAIAGPLFSFGLAFVFAVIVFLIGRPLYEAETSTTVGYVVPESPAAKAECETPGVPPGLRSGDVIEAVDNHPVTRFGGMNGSVQWYVARSEDKTIPFKVNRDGQQLTFNPVPPTQEAPSGWQRKSLRQVSIDPAYTAIIAKVEPGSAAEKAGLLERDVVTAINGQKIYNPLAVSDFEQNHYGQPTVLTVDRGGRTLQETLPATQFKVGDVLDGSPADKSGLKAKDVIAAIDGVAPTRFGDLRERIARQPDQAINLTILRDGQTRPISVTPLRPKAGKDPIIGISSPDEDDGIGWKEGGIEKLVYESPVEQVANSVSTIINTVGAVIAPRSGIKLQHLGGPVFIGRTYYYLLSSHNGWRLALWFSVVLNVNLALLNMLPIPVLDGGHILLALIEAVRRRPVNLRILEVIQTACFVVIAGYMLYVSFYDVGDLAFGRKRARDVEFASPTPALEKK